ncbi:hypothetical protein J132_00778 [Termitomyces sp. J132]|nr:hypothetical protein J132_00778 [Termitomyces sp. J132]
MMFIGKPLPRRIRFHKHRNVHGSMSTDTAQVALIAGSSNLRNELSRSMDEATALRQDTDRSSSASHQNLGSTRSENDTSDNASEVDSGLVACLFCDYTPNGTVAGKPAIDNVFQHNKHVIDSLSTLGICNDQQLDALMDLRMWGIGPDRFFDSIPASELSPLYKAHILSQLKAKQGLILRPPLAIEVKRRIEGSMSFSSEVAAVLDLLINIQAQYRVPWSGCPTHPPTPEWDHVPTKLQTVLRLFNMQELTPIFLMAQVKTNEDFDLLCGLGEVGRTLVFEQLELPYIRRFQRWMLAFLLKNIDILD